MTECRYFEDGEDNDGYCSQHWRFTNDEDCEGCGEWTKAPSEGWFFCSYAGEVYPKSECPCEFFR